MELEILKYLPEKEQEGRPILFVHGAHHGAWCWKEHFLPYFSSKGFSALALSLRGHGGSKGYENLHSFSLDDYVEDVLEVMSSIEGKLILVGHSMGGAVVQRILHYHPEKVEIAVLMASVSHKGMVKDMLRVAVTNLRVVLQMIKFNKGEDVIFPPKVFFSKKLPEEERNRYLNLLQPESDKARNNMFKPIVPLPVSTKIPVLVIGSKKDWYFPDKTARGIARAYGTEAVIFPDISHDMMLDPGWKAVADRMLEFFTDIHKQSMASAKGG